MFFLTAIDGRMVDLTLNKKVESLQFRIKSISDTKNLLVIYIWFE